jgi:hypothetical protein
VTVRGRSGGETAKKRVRLMFWGSICIHQSLLLGQVGHELCTNWIKLVAAKCFFESPSAMLNYNALLLVLRFVFGNAQL